MLLALLYMESYRRLTKKNDTILNVKFNSSTRASRCELLYHGTDFAHRPRGAPRHRDGVVVRGSDGLLEDARPPRELRSVDGVREERGGGVL